MRSKLIYLALGVAVLGITARISLPKHITLLLDDHSQVLRTRAWSVGTALAEAGISLEAGDQLQPPLDSWLLWDTAIRLQRAHQVLILADGELQQASAVGLSPAELLAQVEIPLSEPDQLLLDGEPVQPGQPLPARQRLPTSRPSLLQVRRGIPLIVIDGTLTYSFSSTAATLGAALWEAGIRLGAADRLEPPADTPLHPSLAGKLEATITRARGYTIRSGEHITRVRSAAGTVGELLAESGLAPQGLGYSLPAESEPLDGLREIRIVRVQEEVLLESTALPFETRREVIPDLELDKRQVQHPGQPGLLVSRVRLRYEDGVEVARQVEGEWVARQPEDRLIGHGARPVMHTLDTPEGPIQYWRALQMYATSYHPATTSNTTASGLPLQKGVAAIDRNYILFNTRMYIPGYGIAVAADTGGGVRGKMIDLGYSDHDYVPWSRWVTVYFLWPPPESIPWILP
jgi:resuscitation-promoting factor RpfB